MDLWFSKATKMYRSNLKYNNKSSIFKSILEYDYNRFRNDMTECYATTGDFDNCNLDLKVYFRYSKTSHKNKVFTELDKTNIIRFAKQYLMNTTRKETIPFVFKFICHTFLVHKSFDALLSFCDYMANQYNETVLIISPCILCFADNFLFYEQDISLALKYYKLYYETLIGNPESKIEYQILDDLYNLRYIDWKKYSDTEDVFSDYSFFFLKYMGVIISLSIFSFDCIENINPDMLIFDIWFDILKNFYRKTNDMDIKRLSAMYLHGFRKYFLQYMFLFDIKYYLDIDIKSLVRNFLLYGLFSEDIGIYIRKNYSKWSDLDECKRIFGVLHGLSKIKRDVSEIKRLLRVKSDDVEALCYYSKLDSFKYMLPCECCNKDTFAIKGEAFPNIDNISECGCLTLMDTKYMNDPNEGKIYGRMLFDGAEFVDRLVNNDKYVFIKCFTSLIDDLSMWELYSGKSKGCCIVLDVNESGFLSVGADSFYRVCYVHKENDEYTIQAAFNPFLGERIKVLNDDVCDIQKICSTYLTDRAYINIVYNLLGITRYMFKDSAYSHESEIRLIESREAFDPDIMILRDLEHPLLGLKLKKPVKIDKVILGPNLLQSNTLIPYLNSQLDILSKKNNQPEVIVEKSSIAYIGEN